MKWPEERKDVKTNKNAGLEPTFIRSVQKQNLLMDLFRTERLKTEWVN